MQNSSSRKSSESSQRGSAAAQIVCFTQSTLSAYKIARASMPFTESGLDFELMQSHSYSYSAQTSDLAAMASLRGLEIRASFSDMGIQLMYVLLGYAEA